VVLFAPTRDHPRSTTALCETKSTPFLFSPPHRQFREYISDFSRKDAIAAAAVVPAALQRNPFAGSGRRFRVGAEMDWTGIVVSSRLLHHSF